MGPVVASLLAASALCAPVLPATGTYTYAARIGPTPKGSIALEGATLVVRDFAADRPLTTTLVRYDTKTAALVSATQHGSCCGAEWDSTITRDHDGSYLIATSRFAPGYAQRDPTKSTDRWHIRSAYIPIINNVLELVPWLYRARHIKHLESISLPGISSGEVISDIVDIADGTREPVPTGVASTDDMLTLVRGSDHATVVLWYDPCTLLLDAIKTHASLKLRINQ